MQTMQKTLGDLRPFLSILILILSLLSIVFVKMEIRRSGYSVLRLSREEKRLKDLHRQQTTLLAKLTRPERVQDFAQSRLTLRKPQSGQIIQMTDQGIAISQ